MSISHITWRTEWWVFAAVFAVICLASTIHALRQPRWYQASAMLQVKLDLEIGGASQGPAEALNTLVEVANSRVLILKITEQLNAEEQAAILRSQSHTLTDGPIDSVEQVIEKNRQVMRGESPRTLIFQIRDGDRLMAARIANFFMDEIIAYTARVWTGDAIRHFVNLTPYVQERERRVHAITDELAAYREARSQKTGGLFVPDEHSQALEKQLTEASRQADVMIQKMRAQQGLRAPHPNPLRVLERAVPADEDDYLFASILEPLTWGFGMAVVGGLVAAGVVRIFSRKSRTIHLSGQDE